MTVLGMACNFLALYLIVRKSKDYLSEYRKLLIIFLASDMIFALLHSIAKPVSFFMIFGSFIFPIR